MPDNNLPSLQLFRHENRPDDISPIIDSYLATSSDLKISGLFLMSVANVFDIVQKSEISGYEINKKAFSGSILSFELIRTIDRSERRIAGNVLLIKSSKPNIYFTITDGDLEFVTLAMKRYFEELFPKVSILKFSSRQLSQVLSNLEAQDSLSIIADKTVANNKRESAVTYTGIGFKEAFERAYEEDRWIDKIDFTVMKEAKGMSQSYMTAFLSRNSIFRVSSNFTLFYNNIIVNLASMAQTIYLLYADRGRFQHDKVQTARPLSIEFGYTVFDKPENNKHLVNALKELTNSSVSVIHGNPYLHASIVDLLDGSSYDLWVLSQTRLIIVPQLRATYSSISRICDHIFRKFREGEVKEYEAVSNDARN